MVYVVYHFPFEGDAVFMLIKFTLTDLFFLLFLQNE